MARIRIVLEDDDGREMAGTQARVYDLGRELGHLHEIEGALEQFRRRALPELRAALLAKAQEAELKDQKSSGGKRNGRRQVSIKTIHGSFAFSVQRLGTGEPATTRLEQGSQVLAGNVSRRLGEFSAYYANGLSYEEVEGLMERVTGEKLCSDQTRQQQVVARAVAVSECWSEPTKQSQAPATASVDGYDAQSKRKYWYFRTRFRSSNKSRSECPRDNQRLRKRSWSECASIRLAGWWSRLAAGFGT